MLLVMIFFSVFSPVKMSANGDWYNSNWQYRKKITIDHTKVAQTDQIYFPVLINVTDTDVRTHAQTSGYDILFTDSTGLTQIPYEREQYDSTSGELVAWVQVATLSSTADTTIYMYYGNSAASDQQDLSGGVWDSNFKGVWHSNDATSTTIADSTVNANTGIKQGTTGPLETTGKIGQAQRYDGSDSYIGVVPTGTLTGSFTVSVWAQVSDADIDHTIIGTRSDDDYSFDFKFVNNDTIHGDIGNGFNWITTEADVGLLYSYDTWYQITYVVTTTGYSIYIDGSNAASENYSEDTPILFDATHRFFIGQVGYDNEWFKGAIDEVRISDIVRSADWIQTEYNNQNDPTAFASLGSEETESITPTPTPIPTPTPTSNTTPAAGSCNGSCDIDSDCRGTNGNSNYVCYNSLCRLATNVNDSGCAQSSTTSTSSNSTTALVATPTPIITNELRGGKRISPGVNTTPTNTTPTTETPPASPALFDVISEPAWRTQQNVVPFIVFSVIAGTVLTLSAIFVLRGVKTQQVAINPEVRNNQKYENKIRT